MSEYILFHIICSILTVLTIASAYHAGYLEVKSIPNFYAGCVIMVIFGPLFLLLLIIVFIVKVVKEAIQ